MTQPTNSSPADSPPLRPPPKFGGYNIPPRNPEILLAERVVRPWLIHTKYMTPGDRGEARSRLRSLRGLVQASLALPRPSRVEELREAIAAALASGEGPRRLQVGQPFDMVEPGPNAAERAAAKQKLLNSALEKTQERLRLLQELHDRLERDCYLLGLDELLQDKPKETA